MVVNCMAAGKSSTKTHYLPGFSDLKSLEQHSMWLECRGEKQKRSQLKACNIKIIAPLCLKGHSVLIMNWENQKKSHLYKNFCLLLLLFRNTRTFYLYFTVFHGCVYISCSSCGRLNNCWDFLSLSSYKTHHPFLFPHCSISVYFAGTTHYWIGTRRWYS